MLAIRSASEKDIPTITEIYNDAILHTSATFDTEIKTVDERLIWFKAHDEMHPVLVATFHDEVIGWASLNRWSDRVAYDCTAEVSLYVHKDHRGKGTGKLLLEMLTVEGDKVGLHTLLARITEGNEKSIYLHERLGFENIGILREEGKKFGKYLDVFMLQKVFNPEKNWD